MAKPPPKPPPITILKRRSIAPLQLEEGSIIRADTPDHVLNAANLLASQTFIANESIIFEMMFEGRRAIGSFVLEQA